MINVKNRLSRENYFNKQISLIIFITVLVLAIYWPVQDFSFLAYDDPVYVTENVMVQKGISREGLAWAFKTTEAGFWHPLTWISLMADYELYKLNPAGYHWTNLLLHLLATFLLFRALQAMTGAGTRSLVVAALFALHPLHVESVAWIAERKDVLSACFWMLTIYAYVNYVRKPGYGRYGLALLFFVMGLMSKPMLVTMPFILLLLDFWPLGRFTGAGGAIASLKGDAGRENFNRVYPLLLEKVPLFLLAIVFGILTLWTESGFQALAPTDALPWPDRLATAVVAAATYLGKTFWPTGLAAFYPHPGGWPGLVTAGAAALHILLTLLAFRMYRSRPWLIVGWLWYLITLLPVSGIIQVGSHAMADRYTYIPLIGIFIMSVWSFPRKIMHNAGFGRSVVLAGVAFLLLLLSWRASIQVQYWRNDGTLFRHALEVTTDNYLAHSGLGAYLIRQGQDDAALYHLNQAVAIRPDYAPAWFKRGLLFAKQGRYMEAAASFKQILKEAPRHGDARKQLAWNLLLAGETDAAIVQLRELLNDEPGDASLFNHLGIALMKKGAYPEAGDAFRKALELSPGHAGYHHNLATALLAAGNEEEAIRNLRQALALKPDYAAAHERLAALLRKRGENSAAAIHEKTAGQIRTGNESP